MSSANSFSTLALSDDHGAETNGRGLTNEKSGTLKKALYNAGLEIDSDRNVRWRHNNPEHPRNWPITRKLYDLSIVILLEFFTYVPDMLHVVVLWLIYHALVQRSLLQA